MDSKKSQLTNENQQNILLLTQSLPSSSPNYSPIFLEYHLMKEFLLFQKQETLHLYMSPSNESAFIWFGVIFIHTGFYRGKILRFTIHINPSYPNCDIPMIIFKPIPAHPLVDPVTGHLNLQSKFPKWNSTDNFIFETLLYAKTVFEFDTIEQLRLIANISSDMDHLLFYQNDQQLQKAIDEKMINFNECCIKMKIDDINFINLDEKGTNCSGTMIDRIKYKLLTEKYNSINDPTANDYLNNCNTNAFVNSNKTQNQQFQYHSNRVHNNSQQHYSTSISGLSWAKKIVFN